MIPELCPSEGGDKLYWMSRKHMINTSLDSVGEISSP